LTWKSAIAVSGQRFDYAFITSSSILEPDKMKLSIIDQSPVPAGFTPADALQNTIELARLADRLGYERYWIAEHHAIEALASPAPEVLIARVGAETSGIRVGSGGVMLPHYSPLKVAECFRMLHALYPGRIDLGIGRAPGGTPLETYALMRDRNQRPEADDFPQQLAELRAFLNRSFPEKHPFNRINVSPAMPGAPAIWLLGSSMWSGGGGGEVGGGRAVWCALRIRPLHQSASDADGAGVLRFAFQSFG
jgi:luciferase family oxidoreductase group 1